MARQARQKDDFGIFHIHQTGGGHRRIFETDVDRIHFLSILAKAHSKFDFKLYAYCLISSDAYHLILDVNGGDLSKIMKSLNISYAMYAKCKEKLFKDRYKSTLLKSESEMAEIMTLLRENGQTHERWNSFCVSQDGSPFIIDPVLMLPDSNDEALRIPGETDDCKDCIRSVPEALDKLMELATEEKKSVEEIFQDKEYRNNLIRKFRSHSTLSLKALGTVFGGLSESSVSKILDH